MKEKFDFSKTEDQKEFESLPQEEKDKIVGEAQEEANLIHEKIAPVGIEEQEKKDENEDEKLIERKKINIPGIGEIEYFEKKVMFPENAFKETGVRGYIRKIIPNEEIEKISALLKSDAPEIQKFKQYVRHRTDSNWPNYEDNLKRLICEQISDGNFPKKTFNHTIAGMYGEKEEDLKEFKMNRGILNKVGDFLTEAGIRQNLAGRLSFFPISANDNRIIPFYTLLGSIGVDIKNRIKKWQTHPQTVLEYAQSGQRGTGASVGPEPDDMRLLAKMEDAFYISYYGLNATEQDDYFGNFDKDIIFGFRINTKNAALRKYCIDAKKILNSINLEKSKENKQITQIRGYELPFSYNYQEIVENLKQGQIKDWLSMNKKTLDALLGIKKTYHKKEKMSEKDHPRIPLIVNNQNIPEFRWCYADYISIPTKKGLNILEMITDNRQNEESA